MGTRGSCTGTHGHMDPMLIYVCCVFYARIFALYKGRYEPVIQCDNEKGRATSFTAVGKVLASWVGSIQKCLYRLQGTYKVRNEKETKRNETKGNQRKRNETKRNEINEMKTK
jgi:hypothetical protein